MIFFKLFLNQFHLLYLFLSSQSTVEYGEYGTIDGKAGPEPVLHLPWSQMQDTPIAPSAPATFTTSATLDTFVNPHNPATLITLTFLMRELSPCPVAIISMLMVNIE